MSRKEMLAEFIYLQNEKHPFHINSTWWSRPDAEFLYDNSLSGKVLKDIRANNILSEDTDNIICVLADWENLSEGIIFTDRAIYVNSPKNRDKHFKVRYNNIVELNYDTLLTELEIKTEHESYWITTELWSKLNIYDFLQFAIGRFNFEEKRRSDVEGICLKTMGNLSVGDIVSGITYGNVSNASSMYFDDKIVSPRGHGFAAEHANHLADLYMGKNAKIIGDDNAKNGADRWVDGVNIQSKYCASGSKCVEACFENGSFRYWNPDGSPMQIEVPSDMYDAAIQSMEHRIKNGQVSGVTDPSEAKNIIRKGHFTYLQARNIARAGTVESIIYDAASGAVVARNSFGITAVLTFATELWNGESIEVAAKSAALQGMKVGTVTFITSVLAGQLSKAGLNSLLVGNTDAIIKIMGPKASAVLANALRSGKNIYGAAAMKSASKLLRGNIITSIVSFGVLSIGDVGNIFRGRISGKQLFKNLTETATSLIGGGVGWTAGATAGAALGSVVPVVGNVVGGVVGGVIGALGGGTVASKAASSVMDQFVENDADEMVAIIQSVFVDLASEYLVTQKEAEKIVGKLQKKLNGSILKDMYASGNREMFARKLMEEDFEDIAFDREHIRLPSEHELQLGIKEVLEDVANS